MLMLMPALTIEIQLLASIKMSLIAHSFTTCTDARRWYDHACAFDFRILDIIYLSTGCPAKLFTLGYLLFCRLLIMQNAKVGTFFKNLGNLLHDRHKNFEIRFRNSWDNWDQSCHLQHGNYFSASVKYQNVNF